MFPFLQSSFSEHTFSDPSPSAPPRRIDVQRRSLEYKKMYHLNTMAVEQSYSDLNRELAARKQIQLATNGRVTIVTHLRRNLASILISTGQRIRPEAPVSEPQYNG